MATNAYDTIPTDVIVDEAQPRPRAVSRSVIVGACLALALVVVAAVAFSGHGSYDVVGNAPVDPDVQMTATDTELYKLAGFKVTKRYKCIFPTCTDFWCDANCNHRPRYCPPTFCRALAPSSPPPPPTPPPTAGKPPGSCPTGTILGTSWYTTAAVKSSKPVSLICCPAECKICGGDGCAHAGVGGKNNCCAQGIMPQQKKCGSAPCILGPPPPDASATTEMVAVPPTEMTESDLVDAIGSKEGIGALSDPTESKFEGEWAPWGLSVSGNGMMAEAAAAGTLRVLHEAGILSKLATIASVSGGSWFNTQFAFSKEYYNGVIGSDGTPLDKWYVKYQNTAAPGMMAAAMAGGGWEAMITGMYKWDSAHLDAPAVNANRAGNTNADLLLCTTFMGKSLMSDNKTIVEMTAGGKKMPVSIPAFWTVPTSGTASWSIPDVNPKNPKDLSSAKWQQLPGKTGCSSLGCRKSSNFKSVLPTPTVAKIGSMSSAANGITSNPALIAEFKPQSSFKATFGGYQNPKNGVCTGKTEDCTFGQMAMDGCYSDNLGFALNVGYLQKKYRGKKLRMMAVSSELCDRTKDPSCLNGVKVSSFRSLFADAPYPTVEGWLPSIVPGPNRTIFAESVSDYEALGQQTGFGGMTFTTGTFTTIKNDHFGVEAGTKVSLLVLNVNGPQYLQGQTTAEQEGLANVATNAYNSWQHILKAYELNGKITSDKAFLYYQDVGN